MIMGDILFSIVIPTYNRAAFIGKTINSLLSQTYNNFEIIVVDDGSVDNTSEVLNGITDSRVAYYKKENGERGAARNYGARLAKGSYINFFDSDDLAYPNHLAEAYKFINANSRPSFFHLGYDFKSPDGSLIRNVDDLHGDLHAKLIRNNFLSCNGVFLSKELSASFPFEEDRTLAVAEDWALWLRISSRYPILVSNVITSSVICHDERSIMDYNIEKVVKRDLLLLKVLFNDDQFKAKYKKYLPVFTADRYTFFSLLLSLKKRKRECVSYLFKAFKAYPLVILERRFWASVKHMIK